MTEERNSASAPARNNMDILRRPSVQDPTKPRSPPRPIRVLMKTTLSRRLSSGSRSREKRLHLLVIEIKSPAERITLLDDRRFYPQLYKQSRGSVVIYIRLRTKHNGKVSVNFFPRSRESRKKKGKRRKGR